MVVIAAMAVMLIGATALATSDSQAPETGGIGQQATVL